jgi:hypothetical protein
MFISDLQSKRFIRVWVLFSLKDSHSLPHPIHDEDIGLPRRFEGDHRQERRFRNGLSPKPANVHLASIIDVTKMTQNRRGDAIS